MTYPGLRPAAVVAPIVRTRPLGEFGQQLEISGLSRSGVPGVFLSECTFLVPRQVTRAGIKNGVAPFRIRRITVAGWQEDVDR